jgi:hypothetical protein
MTKNVRVALERWLQDKQTLEKRKHFIETLMSDLLCGYNGLFNNTTSVCFELRWVYRDLEGSKHYFELLEENVFGLAVIIDFTIDLCGNNCGRAKHKLDFCITKTGLTLLGDDAIKSSVIVHCEEVFDLLNGKRDFAT